MGKRQRAGAVQDAGAQSSAPGGRASVLDCASPLALFTVLLSALLLLTLPSHADSLTTLDGKSFTGKVTIEPGAFVVTAAGAAVQRVPLADVRAVKFDRAASTTRAKQWEARSVGPDAAAGSFVQTNGQFLVHGAGTSYTVDDGHYFVQQTVGETARLTAFVPPQVGTRGGGERYKVAGLAILGRFDAAGPAYYVLSEGTKSGITRWRTDANKERSKHFNVGPQGVWLRLELCGQHVGAFASDDGIVWRQVGSEVIAFPEAAHAGLLVAGMKKGSLASAAFTHVELLHADAPLAALPQLRLRDGGVLAGRFVSTDGSVVRWQALGREWQVSLVNVSRLVLDPRGAATAARLASGRPGALLASGDFVDGELVAGAEGRVTISSVLFGLKSWAGEGSVLAVHLREPAEAAADFELHCADGTRLLASQVELHATSLAGRERSAGEFLVRAEDVSELVRAKRP